MNWTAVLAIYRFEMARFVRTFLQSIISPVISTSLYFVVFGAAIGSRIDEVEGVSYGAFIVPGLVMLSVMTQAISNASFGIYFPKFIGTIYELLSAPISFAEVIFGYVGAAATKPLFIGTMILVTATFFRFWWSRRSSFWAARSTRSRCCRRPGRRSPISTRWSISCRASAGRSSAWPMCPSASASWRSAASPRSAC